jgi:hypothetical protein
MSNEPEPISNETMQAFIQNHRDFLIGIWEWITYHTDRDDIDTMNIFTEWIGKALRQSHGMMKADNEAMKKGQIH